MADSTLQDIINELTDAESKLNATITKQFGKVEGTDFSNEYAELQDVLKKLNAFVAIPPSVVEEPTVEETVPVESK